MKRAIINFFPEMILNEIIHIGFLIMVMGDFPAFSSSWWCCMALIAIQLIIGIVMVALVVCGGRATPRPGEPENTERR